MTDPTPPAWHRLPHAPAAGTVVCAVAEIPDGGARFVDFGPAEAAFRLLLLRSGETVFGYLNRCAHFGVPLAKHEGQLILKAHESVTCNVHYARFRWQDGFCDRGDCEGEALVAVPLDITGGIVRIAATVD